MDAFLAMIAYFGFNFVPYGWAACNGQLLTVQQNSALFALLGAIYGGNGTSNFGLPDLRGRVVLGAGVSTASNKNYNQGNPTGNTETVTLTVNQMPMHSHTATIGAASATIKAYSQVGTSALPVARGNINVLSGSTSGSIYGTIAPDIVLNVGGGAVAGSVIVDPNGSSNPVSIMQPYCVLNACICTSGIYPTRQ
jgi:microcystin-dependent protein